MAGTVEDNATAVDWRLASGSAHTIDDLFQILVCARDIPAPIAKKQITKFLQLNKLQIDFHVRGGARKTVPTRPATEEKLKAWREKRATLDHLYEVAPPEGVTGRVNFQSWERMFRLRIDDGRLIVEPGCPLDYPWDAYSFTIANWSLINELWPPLVTTFVPPAFGVEEPPTPPLSTPPPEFTPLATPLPAQESRPTLVTQAEEPQEEGPEEIAEVAPAVPTVLPDDPAAILSLLGLKGPKQRVIAEAVPKLYQGNPPENLTPTQLCEAVNGLQNTRAQASGARASPSQMVKWDTGDRFVRALRAWRAKQRALS